MTEWYYRDNLGCKVGPLTTAEFDVCVTVGEVRPETRVWRSGLTKWTTYAQLQAAAETVSPARRSRQRVRSPQSVSYHCGVALGLSAQHVRPTQARLVTSAVANAPEEEAADEAEIVWADDVPATIEIPEPLLSPAGADGVWLGRQFVRIGLLGALFVLIHFFYMEYEAERAVQAVTAPAELSVSEETLAESPRVVRVVTALLP